MYCLFVGQTIKPRYSLGEEIANSITHGVGAILAIAGLAILTAFSALKGDVWHLVACSIYGATLIFQYTASTLYHSITNVKAKSVLQVIDHIAILFLIAGTYTPVTLVNLRGPWGWSLFGVLWGLVVAGVIIEVTPLRKIKSLSIGLYMLMGWVAVIAIKPIFASIETGGLVFLFLGGLFYSIGVIFYGWKRLPFNHAIWHLFVFVGSVLHFFMILFYVIP
jgi:hemolysin III